MTTDTPKLYSLVSVWMTLIFMQDTDFRNLCSHSVVTRHKAVYTISMVGCLREMTAGSPCKYGKYGSCRYCSSCFWSSSIGVFSRSCCFLLLCIGKCVQSRNFLLVQSRLFLHTVCCIVRETAQFWVFAIHVTFQLESKYPSSSSLSSSTSWSSCF